MNKKGSMELSVNSIVILVIAIVMLGLILGFVKSKFGDLNKKFNDNEPAAPQPTSTDPVTMSRPSLVVNAGETATVNFKVYLMTTSTTAKTAAGDYINIPTIKCGSNNFGIDTTGKAGNPGDIMMYTALVKIPNTMSKGKTLCTLGFGDPAVTDNDAYNRDIIVEVI